MGLPKFGESSTRATERPQDILRKFWSACSRARRSATSIALAGSLFFLLCALQEGVHAPVSNLEAGSELPTFMHFSQMTVLAWFSVLSDSLTQICAAPVQLLGFVFLPAVRLRLSPPRIYVKWFGELSSVRIGRVCLSRLSFCIGSSPSISCFAFFFFLLAFSFRPLGACVKSSAFCSSQDIYHLASRLFMPGKKIGPP